MRIALAAAVSLAFAAPAMADEPRRELGAHQHGHGKLNIAVEGTKVSMELEVPGADIVGFEHEPSTPEQKAAVDNGKAKLADALTIFTPASAAKCKLVKAEVVTQVESEEEHAREHAAEGKTSETKAAEVKAPAAMEQHIGEEARHSEFHAEYFLECAAIERLTTLTFDYFKAFTGAQELDITIVTPKGQTAYEVTREKPTLDLTGVM